MAPRLDRFRHAPFDTALNEVEHPALSTDPGSTSYWAAYQQPQHSTWIVMFSQGTTMDGKKLAQILISVGIIAVIAALLWWASFYGPIMQDLGGDLSSAYSCIYSSSGGCSIASGVAQLAGKTPYNPVLFWIGAASWAVGVLILATMKKQDLPPPSK